MELLNVTLRGKAISESDIGLTKLLSAINTDGWFSVNRLVCNTSSVVFGQKSIATINAIRYLNQPFTRIFLSDIKSATNVVVIFRITK